MNNSQKIIEFFRNNWLVAVIALVITAIIYFNAVNIIDYYRESRFDKEREELLQKAEKAEQNAKKWQEKAKEFEANEQRLADYNKVLKAVNDKQAEMLDASDIKRLERESETLEIAKEKLADKLSVIESTSPDNQKSELCKEGKEIGVVFSFCQ